jgi:hypothetical protein
VPPAASRRVAPPAPTREPVADAKPAPEAVEISAVDEPSTEATTPAVTDTPSLATVTRLPVVAAEVPEPRKASDDLFPQPPAAVEAPADDAAPVDAPSDVVAGLRALGVPSALLGDTFAEDAAVHGTYSALTRALSLRLPQAPTLPTGAGEVLLVVGPGLEALRTAQSLAVSLRLDPDRVQWATRGDLAGLAPSSSRVTTTATAIERQKEAAAAGTVTIVAVDAPLRADSFWTAQMMAIWSPTAVWAMVEATRKPEDLGPWLDGLPRVDALIVQDTDLSADPAAVLRRAETPVVLLDGARATAHRWASLLCERLESAKG